MVFTRNTIRTSSYWGGIFTCLFLCLTAGLSAGESIRTSNNYVLIINSHTESTTWSHNIISPVVDHVSANGLDVFTEHMNMMVLEGEDLLLDFENRLFEKYDTKPPRLLILLDNSAVLLKDAILKHWKDVPIVLCAEQDFIGPPHAYFTKKTLLPEEQIPLSVFLEDCNLTFLHSPVFLKENVELIRYVIPNMKRLIFVADGRYINQHLNEELTRVMKEEYGQIKYEFFSADSVTADKLMRELGEIDSWTTGVLFSSWIQKSNVSGNTLLLANSHKVFAANSVAPLFSLRYGNVKDGGMIGGYIIDNEAYMNQLLSTITEILEGKSPREIPFYTPSGGIPTFNYAALLQKGLAPEMCPPHSKFIAMPPTFYQKNKHLIFAGAFVLLTLVSLIIQHNRRRSLRKIKAAQQQLRDTNEKLAMALGVANIISWKWDVKKRLIYYDHNTDNRYAERESFILAVDDYFAAISNEDKSNVYQEFEELLKSTTQRVHVQFRVSRFNGKRQGEYWVEAHAAIVEWDKTGDPLIVIGSLLNITERKKMEKDLVQEKERAEESSRLKSAFLANISHEIRTPLNAIVGFSTILVGIDEPEEKFEYIHIIEKNNELLLRLIDDIIDFSKIEAGSLEFRYMEVELNELMREYEQVILPKINENRISLIFEPGLPVCNLWTDKKRFTQLMMNMLINAAKFTSEGSIRFGYRKRDKDLYFYVIDTGCGIPQNKLKAIFKRFVKLDDFTQGTGLGLSICQFIVQQMGGDIGVESEEGKGSTFWFTLPYDKPLTS